MTRNTEKTALRISALARENTTSLAPAPLQLDLGDLIVPHIVPLQDSQHCDADHRGNQHDQRHHCPVPEVGNASQHLRVEDAGDHLKTPAHRRRNTEVRKAEEKCLDKRRRQSPEKGLEYGHPEGLEWRVSHKP